MMIRTAQANRIVVSRSRLVGDPRLGLLLHFCPAWVSLARVSGEQRECHLATRQLNIAPRSSFQFHHPKRSTHYILKDFERMNGSCRVDHDYGRITAGRILRKQQG